MGGCFVFIHSSFGYQARLRLAEFIWAGRGGGSLVLVWIYAARSADMLYITPDLLFWPDRTLEVFVVDNSMVSTHDIFPPSVANDFTVAKLTRDSLRTATIDDVPITTEVRELEFELAECGSRRFRQGCCERRNCNNCYRGSHDCSFERTS